VANEGMGRDRDLVLAPGEFAYVKDTTKGLVNTIVGPNKISMSNTDQPVIWDKNLRRIVSCDVDKAIQINSIAPEGFYIALYNPAENDKNPQAGMQANSATLRVGHRVNLPGPIQFPLWPGQMATVIQGHHLRSNQYLLAQVYNDTAASENWKTAVVKPQGDGEVAVQTPRSFVPGQLIIIKGTDVAFFIPPTGIKVVAESPKVYVREAVTLERLEYCILLDEDGNKRFVQGPDVVFPEPTETFVTKDNMRKFRAIELNETTGIYVKVIADYKEGDKEYKTGDELFITGKEQAIYFQREEHSVIRYGDQTKHYAVAVPSGEGRYVLNRNTGVVDLVIGPKMLLCDPRHEVIVRRVLAEKTVRLWYPNNEDVVKVNVDLAAQANLADSSQYAAGRAMRSSSLMAMNYSDEKAIASSRQIAGDTFSRGTTFQPPRTITLDTKYEGAVSINVWTGYAVLVINKTGQRHVVVGPETILLQYDETLAPLELSTGRPKSDEKLFRTVYLRVHNNKVSDQIRVETKDLVPVNLTVSYRVNFEGEDPENWFAVENYVRLLCDHMRSLIRNVAKRKTIEEFYGDSISIVRDTILGVSLEQGKPRPGRSFIENGMNVYDVEVLNVSIDNPNVATLLGTAQMNSLKSAIQIAEEERTLAFTIRSEDIKRQAASIKATTVEQIAIQTNKEITANHKLSLARVMSEAEAKAEKLRQETLAQTLLNGLNTEELARQKAINDEILAARSGQVALELKRILGETEEIVKRAAAINPSLAVALTTFADQALVEKMTTALAPMAAMSGVSTADVLGQLFSGTPFEGVMKTLGTRSRMPEVIGKP